MRQIEDPILIPPRRSGPALVHQPRLEVRPENPVDAGRVRAGRLSCLTDWIARGGASSHGHAPRKGDGDVR